MRTPVVMYSARTDSTVATDALRHTAAEFVTKPPDGELLRRVVCEASHSNGNGDQRDAA